jgi:hypothetical protein
MIDSAPRNLYSTGAAAPFAGRGSAFARLRRQLTDPAHHGALLVLGRQRIGKSAFLHAFHAAFDESFVGIYVPLRTFQNQQESEWWLGIAQTITEHLIERAFTLTRLQELQPPETDARDWFTSSFLPPVLALIRPHRRLVLLLDDIDALLDAMQQGFMRPDTLTYLRAMLDQFSQFHVVPALSLRFEARLSELHPLVLPTNTVRLTSLSPDETAWLLSAPVQQLYTIDADALTAAHRLTGGEPAFAQTLGAALFKRYLSEDKTTFTAEDIKRAGQSLYRQIELDLRDVWESLTYNEQRVLKAISQLIYADPLRPVELNTIAAWLADTDDPLDSTGISAALRSLEYREVVALLPEGIRIESEWMQRFLLENAYNVPLAAAPPSGSMSAAGALLRRNRGLRIALLLILVAMLIAGIVLLSALSSLPQEAEIIPSQPTVTLFGGG